MRVEFNKGKPNNSVFLIKFLIYLLLMFLGAFLVTYGETVAYIIGFILLGAAFTHGVELEHQSVHKLGFSNKYVNYFTGIALGLPMMVSFTSYRINHMFHHKAVGTLEDKEFFNYRGNHKGFLARMFALLFMQIHFQDVTNRILQLLSFKKMAEKKQDDKLMKFEYFIMLCVILLAVALSFSGKYWLVFSIWLGPLFFIAGPLHSLIELPEHFGCDNNDTDIYRNTRSIKSNWIMTWFTNGNNYHVEHHLYPGANIESLEKIHQFTESKIKFLNKSYTEFFLLEFRKLFYLQ